MDFEEHAAKPLLAAAGIAVPRGRLARDPGEAEAAARELGPVVVKAQVAAGGRGKAGGVRAAADPAAARRAAERILGGEIAGHPVRRVLVEERCAVRREFYAAVLADQASKGPLLVFSNRGGIDIEAAAAAHPARVRRAAIDYRLGLDEAGARRAIGDLDVGGCHRALAGALAALYRAYAGNDAELLEVNPLALTAGGALVALDCKFVLDDSALARRPELGALGAPETLSGLERRAREAGLRYIALGGDVGVLANGAGLTMTTMDAIVHHGGRPANFLEIGGEAYTRGGAALELLAAVPGLRSLVINFCGAFARTDVMMAGVLDAWQALDPGLPVFFSVHGTGAGEARALLEARLGVTPCAGMDAAVAAAVAAAREAPAR